MNTPSHDELFYHQKSSVKVGEIERYIITYSPSKKQDGKSKGSLSLSMMDTINQSIFLQIKNVSKSTYSANYIMGPFDLYCDVRTQDYCNNKRVVVSAKKPKYKSQLSPQKKFVVELSMHQLQDQYVWVVDVISGMIFSTENHTSYELTIGVTKDSLKCNEYRDRSLNSSWFEIKKLNTRDLWEIPPIVSNSDKPKHLVLLTHGLHSNTTVDMLYMKEEIERQQSQIPNEELMITGFTKNVCQTEKGIKYLGTRLAEYIIDLLKNHDIRKISFIGHSLGGLVQSFAIVYISVKEPELFNKLTLENFIALASPLLGLAAHNPKYVKYSLSHGVMGQTGKDLGLHRSKTNDNIPLLYLLSGQPFQTIIKRFKRKTIYANCENDGIVPLYTSSLLYLEYKQIMNSLQEFKEKKHARKKVSSASLFTSVSSMMTQPTPSSEFIDAPNLSKNPILHDKIYTQDDCEKLRKRYADSFLKHFLKHKAKGHDDSYQGLIADQLQMGTTWRKVIVALPPDSHNNIIVRRRFTNAHGWPIVEHLVQTHFGDSDETDVEDNVQEEIPEEETKELDISWLSTVDKTSTGILSSTSRLIDRKWHKRKSVTNETTAVKSIEDDSDGNKKEESGSETEQDTESEGEDEEAEQDHHSEIEISSDPNNEEISQEDTSSETNSSNE